MIGNLRGVSGALVALGLLMFAVPAAHADLISISVMKTGVGGFLLNPLDGAGQPIMEIPGTSGGLTLVGITGVEPDAHFYVTRTSNNLELNLTDLVISGVNGDGFAFDIEWSTSVPFETSQSALGVHGSTTANVGVSSYVDGYSLGGNWSNGPGTISGQWTTSFDPQLLNTIRMRLNITFSEVATVNFPGSLEATFTAPVTAVPEPIPAWFSPVVLAATVLLGSRWKRRGVSPPSPRFEVDLRTVPL